MKKEDKIERFRAFVNAPVSSGSALAGLNLCDIYLNIQDREYVLDTIKYRFPNATENLDSAEDWFEKLSSLKSKDSYISAFVGQAGEFKAVERLEDLGKNATLYESRIHPDNDLVDSDNIEWSVKSYAADDLHILKSVISDHTDSKNYIVNTEAFEKLSTSGDLNEYAEKGITIIDGKFSHTEHLQLASERLNFITGDITDEVYDGIWDDVPVVAAIVTTCNIGINISKYLNRQVTEREATADIIKSLSKLTAAGGGAAAGGTVGASLGSAIFPLAGTLIGGGVGAFLGAMGARELMDEFINGWKWGETRFAYEHFSSNYNNSFSSEILKNIKKKFYYHDQIQKNLALEQKRLLRYDSELELSNSTEPTVSSVLVSETVVKLQNAISRIDSACDEIFDQVINFCIDCGLNKYPGKREKSKKYATDMYGSIIAENADWLINLDQEGQSIIDAMKVELQNYPNNPYKLEISKEKLLGVLALMTLKTKGNRNE